MGPVLVDQPTANGRRALHVRRPDDKPADGATWNFPLGCKGALRIRLMLRQGFAGGSIALGDRMFEPSDDNGERLAMYQLPLPPDGRIGDRVLAMGEWHTIELAWDLGAASCQVRVNAAPTPALALANPTGNGICYLRLRSTAQEVDPVGFLVDSVSVEIEDPTAPPRTVEQNRATEAAYRKQMQRLRNAPGATPQRDGTDEDGRQPASIG